MKTTLERSFLALVFAAIAAATFFPLQDFDLMWHLAAGRHLATHGLPGLEPFSYLIADRPWMAEYWLYELALYGLYSAGGYSLLVAARVALVFALFAVWWLALRRSCRPWVLGVQFIATLFFLYHRLWMRPELLSFIFFSAGYILLDRAASWTWRRTVAVFALLQLAWVNLHQSFFLEPMLALFFAAEAALAWVLAARRHEPSLAERARLGRYLVAAAVGAAASLANPYGWHYLTHTFSIIHSKAYFDLIYEWKPLFYFPDLLFRPFYVGFFAVSVLLLAACGRHGRLLHWLLLALLGWQTWNTWRTVALLGVALIPINCHSVTTLLAGRGIAPAFFRTLTASARLAAGAATVAVATAALLLVALVSGLFYRTLDPSRAFAAGLRHETYPETSAERLRAAGVRGNLLNTYAFGGYLMWTLADRCKIGTDGRCVIYPAGPLRDYIALTENRGDFDVFVQQHAIVACVLDLQWPELAYRLLRQRERWALLAVGPQDVSFVRRDAATSQALAQLEITPAALDSLVLPGKNAPAPLPACFGYRVNFFAEAGRPELALRQMDEIAVALRDPVKALVWRAQLLVRLNRPREAGPLFAQALERDPRCFDAALGLAVLAFNRGDWPGATGYARRATDLRPRDPAALHVFARCLAAGAETGRAIALLKRAAQLEPEDYSIWLDLGRLQSEHRQEADAIVALERVLALQPRLPAALGLLSTLYEQNGRGNEAVPLLRELLRLDPANLKYRQRLRRLEKRPPGSENTD